MLVRDLLKIVIATSLTSLLMVIVTASNNNESLIEKKIKSAYSQSQRAWLNQSHKGLDENLKKISKNKSSLSSQRKTFKVRRSRVANSSDSTKRVLLVSRRVKIGDQSKARIS